MDGIVILAMAIMDEGWVRSGMILIALIAIISSNWIYLSLISKDLHSARGELVAIRTGIERLVELQEESNRINSEIKREEERYHDEYRKKIFPITPKDRGKGGEL